MSVIIPTYNRAARVGGAIDSVLAQTRVPHEIIVVDDGSIDQTPDVLADYVAPVRVIRQDHAGVSAARNAGLARATGDLIAFLDDDDRLAPSSLERRAALLESQPDTTLVYTDVRLIMPDGAPLDLFSERYPVKRPSGIVLADLALHNFITLSSVMVRAAAEDRSLLQFDESLARAEDFDLWLRLAPQHRFVYLDEPLTDYCTSEPAGSLTRWGLAGSHSAHDRRQMQTSEIIVQARVFAMPAFRSLTAAQQARIYCSHGVKHAMIHQWPVARRCFARAIRTAPFYPAGYVLGILSVFGSPAFNAAILARRWVARFKARYV